MADKYFAKFPNIYYNGVICKDIARRVTVNPNAGNTGIVTTYYPYTIDHHMRPDHVAEYYHKDPEQDWLIFLVNGITDPYYEWYLEQDQFESMIAQKYGSTQYAKRHIKFWRNNWYNDPNEITVAQYEADIDISWRKYYQPRWGMGQRIVSYVRKQIDEAVNTNEIARFGCYDPTGIFQAGEMLNFLDYYGGNVVGEAEVITANLESVIVQSTYNNTNNYTWMVGATSNVNAQAVDRTTLVRNIPLSESVFWSPVTYYDWEMEINRAKKDILLVGHGLEQIISKTISEKLRVNVDTRTGLTEE